MRGPRATMVLCRACVGGTRPRTWALAHILAAGALCCCLPGSPVLGFSGAASCVRGSCSTTVSNAALAKRRVSGGRPGSRVLRCASDFSSGKSKGSGKGFSTGSEVPGPAAINKRSNSEEPADEAAAGLVKDSREGKSKALSTSKLKDLRDKTLALRQKREAELDEYEEGRAMIAKYGPKVAVMPEKVAQRAAKRGMVIGGSFYGVMLAVFAAGIILFKTQELIIPPTLMAFVTLALLALAIGGSSYGMMSASWDEDREGSLLGTEEFGKNVKSIGEGFRRLSMQDEYEKAITLRKERKALLQAKEDKKSELLNK